MARQSYSGPVRWIIVDDGEVPSSVTIKRSKWTVEIIRPQPFWTPGNNTQGRNLALAMERVGRDDLAVFIEDDDWYHAHWLDQIAAAAKQAELIGEANAIYYNVRSRKWRELRNYEHASLRCSAIHGRALDTFREVLKTPYDYYDMRLWRLHSDKHLFESRLTVGMKAMPGRTGIALGHDGVRGAFDKDGDKLRSLVGDDADWYLQLYQESPMNKWIVTKPFRYNKRNWKVGEQFVPLKRIDAELHAHAKKVELRADTLAPSRKLKVENQTAKAAQVIVEKAPEPAPEVEDDKPRKRGKLSAGL